ncbi:MAG: hypothetical protein K6E98_13135 [Lachnospiraceae bacterium]|nr:hypothetical protein [Lachnospiraceae bacterium]
MKYGESSFDIIYLLFAIISGIIILTRAKVKKEKYMGIAVLLLGCGDAFHLIPRVLNYFTDWDMTAFLGIGKFITSITMTFFYVLLYFILSKHYDEEYSRPLRCLVFGMAVLRVVLCMFPQNGWIQNRSDMTWGIIRNIPFVILGAVICYLFYKKRDAGKDLRFMWVYILFSFLFYIPVAVGAGLVPMLGMLMLPKTICYILMIVTFLKLVMKSH